MNLDHCQDVVELVTEYLEGTLSPQDRAAFEAHLADCDDCDVYLEQVRSTIATLGRVRGGQHGGPTLPPATVEGLVAAFGALRRPPEPQPPGA